MRPPDVFVRPLLRSLRPLSRYRLALSPAAEKLHGLSENGDVSYIRPLTVRALHGPCMPDVPKTPNMVSWGLETRSTLARPRVSKLYVSCVSSFRRSRRLGCGSVVFREGRLRLLCAVWSILAIFRGGLRLLFAELCLPVAVLRTQPRIVLCLKNLYLPSAHPFLSDFSSPRFS
jgi:hypothetical protein